MKSSLRWHVGSAMIALAGITVGPMAVAQIDVTPRLQVRQTWTDTANLDINGRNGDFITTISPGVQIDGTTRRVQAFIDYTLNGLVFWKDSSNSDIRHQLEGAVNTEVIDDRFFVDLRASVRQQFNTFDGQVNFLQDNFTQNRSTVQNYTITPRWREEVGTFAVAQLSYTFGITEQEVEGAVGPVGFISDSTSHRASFSLNSGPSFNRFNWDWQTTYQNVQRDFRNLDLESIRSVVDMSYNLNREIAVLGSVGYEDIRDQQLAAPQEGVIWDVGLRLRPGPRTEIEGRVGERFGGTVFSGRFSYALSAKDSIQASYSEDLTVQNRGLANRFNDNLDFNNDGLPDFDIINDPFIGGDGFVTDSVFRQKRASMSFNRVLRRSTHTATAFWDSREFPAANNFSSKSYGATIASQVRLDNVQTVSAQATYRHNNFVTGFEDDFISFAPSYSYSFGPNLNASAQYTFTKRFSNRANLDRATNSVSLNLTAFF